MKIILSYPPKELNPNKRLHWAKVAKAKKDYKDLVMWEAIGHKPILPDEGNIQIVLTFHPPDNRLRDDDNAISAFKAGRDGLATLWNVNDRRFRPIYKFGAPIKGGRVVVEIL